MMHKTSGTPSFEPELMRAGLEITKKPSLSLYIEARSSNLSLKLTPRACPRAILGIKSRKLLLILNLY